MKERITILTVNHQVYEYVLEKGNTRYLDRAFEIRDGRKTIVYPMYTLIRIVFEDL